MSVPTFVRRGPRAADNYTMIANGLIRDRRLSDHARMLAIWLLSHREGFRVDTETMGQAMNVGRDRTRASVRELEAAGYLTRVQLRDRGRLTSMEYAITDIPEAAAGDGFSGDGNHGPENPSSYKKTKFDKDQPEEDQEISSSPDGDGVIATSGGIPLTEDVLDAMVQDAEDGHEDALFVVEAAKRKPPRTSAAVNRVLDEEFEGAFWPEVPRKAGKHAALVAFRRVRRNGASLDDLVSGMRRFAKDVEGRERRFVAHPSTWLNGGRWLDEPEVGPRGPSGVSGPAAYQDDDYWK